MAGFRDFQTGEVLTAANVNDFLMQQSVMKFADASARDTALGTAVGGGNALREGMMSYADDENAVKYYDGSLWRIPGKVLQVVQGVLSTAVTNNTSTPVDTGLTATITPSSTTSSILVFAYHGGAAKESGNANSSVAITILRNGTQIGYENSVNYTGTNSTLITSWSWTYIDSPSSTSALTYKTTLNNLVNATGVTVGRSLGSGFQAGTIQLVEIAG